MSLLAANVAAAGACMAREQLRGWKSESDVDIPTQDGLGLASADKLAEQGLDKPSSRAWAGSPGVTSTYWGSVLMWKPALMGFL